VPKPTELPVSTSLPPEFPEKQQELFREILGTLNHCQVPYTVSGAFALQFHTGIWRNTKDLDLFLPAKDVTSALQCLQAKDFMCEVRDPVGLAKAHRDGYFVDFITGMSNAVFTVDESWIRFSIPAVILGVSTRVLGAEELLVSKLFVLRRERFDGADVVHLIYATHGRLDWKRILYLVGDHWEVLLGALVLFRYVYPASSHYVPADVWQGLLDRFSQQLATPNPAAPFRGSLVDENMFAIDVAEWGMTNMLEKSRTDRQPGIILCQDMPARAPAE